MPGELRSGGKPWEAFKLYRDAGPGRTLRTVAETLYGDRWRYGLRTVEKWSSEFDWVERVAGMDARDEMVGNARIDHYIASRAHEFEEQQHKIRQRMLDVAAKAAERAAAILDAPMYQTVERIEGGPDGEDVRIVIHNPAGWNTNTARHMIALAAKAIEHDPQNDKPPPIDLDKCTAAELDRLANQEDPRHIFDSDRLFEVRKRPS